MTNDRTPASRRPRRRKNTETTTAKHMNINTHVRVSCEVIRRIMGIRSADITAEVKAKLLEYA